MIFIIIPILVVILTAVVLATRLPEKLNLIDAPGGRKQHSNATPTVGGLVLYISILAGTLFLNPEPKLFWMISSVSILVVVGALDDVLGLSVKIRLGAQSVASLTMIAGGQLYVASFGLHLDVLESIPIWFAICFTTIAIIGITNGFNMVDGIDGLASGHALVSLTVAAFAMLSGHGAIPQLTWFLMFFSATLTFFLINMKFTPLKKVFLGDSGSMLLGFIVGWMLVYYSQDPIAAIHPVSAIWCIALPVWDVITVVCLRLASGASPFSSDRNHLHYLIIELGVRPKFTLLSILCSAAGIGFFGVWLTSNFSPEISLICYLVFLACYGFGVYRLAALGIKGE